MKKPRAISDQAKVDWVSSEQDPVLITGGSGFIGTNLADRLLSEGQRVLLFDNLSRAGVENNYSWLKKKYGKLLDLEIADVRDYPALKSAVKHASRVFHFAAQVAVTTSLVEPMEDFETNARGTLNLLEAIRQSKHTPPLVFTSTNKVYGALQELELKESSCRYEPVNPSIRAYGVDENRPLDFHSPYGCSKGAADQYVLDYARTYSLPACVFRMSCIYGPHQHGTEDQGWIAFFLIQAIEQKAITLYGNGKQVRDVLFVDDLIDAFLIAQQNIKSISGQAFNIGGGANNRISLIELLDLIRKLHGSEISIRHDEWRQGDQKYFVSDTRKFTRMTQWERRVGLKQGIETLYHWLLETRSLPLQERELAI